MEGCEKEMTRTVIITGASAGLGRAFFEKLKTDEKIDAFWLIARRKEKLEQLAGETDKQVKVLPLDLTDPQAANVLKAELEREKPDVRMLINCAGLGRIGRIDELSKQESEAMVDLNCRAIVDVTNVTLPYLSRGSGILNIASVAGFQPISHFGIYSASKAFVENYTKVLHHELLLRHIHVTCVCPYWIKDTEFIGGAQKEKRTGFRHIWLPAHSRSVVSLSLAALKINAWVCTPDIISTIQRICAWIVPDFIVTPFMELISRI
jgi:short-subunit dehydrogenase